MFEQPRDSAPLYRQPQPCHVRGMTALKDRARQGRAMLEDAILDALEQQPGGFFNNELARFLEIESDYEGRQSNYLTYSLLGGLLADGRVVKEKRGSRTFYLRPQP